jgi:hypothetical protein
LQNFFATNTGISGTLPTFAACTALLQFIMNNCPGITTYTNGCFSTQKYMTDLQLNGCSFPAASINAILANLRTSSAISGRVGCSVDLSGSGMSAPTGQGITDKTYLNGLSGWSVSTE